MGFEEIPRRTKGEFRNSPDCESVLPTQQGKKEDLDYEGEERSRKK